MPWKPSRPGQVPTLGHYVIEWIEDNLIVPDGPLSGEPLVLTREQMQFVVNLYAIDPHFSGQPIQGGALVNGRYVRRAILSRPKGWGKSPLLAALCLCEALADVVPDGWDEHGQPVGRSWASLGFKPKVQIVAVSEDQTANTWDPLLEMCRFGPVGRNYGIEALESFVNVPRGRIEFVTSSSSSREGFRPVFSALDQTELWTPSNGGVKLAATIRRNLAKVNGTSVETPNAHIPGEDSVAEKSYEATRLLREGRSKTLRGGILLDHREAPADTDPAELASLRAGLAYAYGESASDAGGWVNLDRIVQDYWDPSTEPQDARRFYLNQVTHAIDSWLTQPEVAARVRPFLLPDGTTDDDAIVHDDEIITLGFDGSQRRNRGVTDATALIGTRVRDGHMFQVAVWEQPEGPAGQDWEVPRVEVDTVVREAFKRWRVAAFYADPAKWESHVAAWEASFGGALKVKATRDHPIEWWMVGGRSAAIVRATDALHEAVVEGGMSYDGASTLTRHLLNARRRATRSGIQIAKEHPDSPRKIDAAVAAILSWQARLDAIAADVLTSMTRQRSKVIHRR